MGHHSRDSHITRDPWVSQVDGEGTEVGKQCMGTEVLDSVQHSANAFASQFSTHTCALWLHNCGMFIPFSLEL